MKNSFKIIVTILLLIFITLSVYLIIKDVYDKKREDNKIELFGKTINSLEEIKESDIQDYLNMVRLLFREKTYEQFSDNDITIYIAYELLNYKNVSNTEVQKFVEKTFGKKNFQLKEGKYNSSIGDEITIVKNGDNFTTSIPGRGIEGTNNYYKSMEVEGNQVIVHYDYKKVLYLGPPIEGEEQFELYGTTDIYLKYSNNNLILEKIIYTKE
ncbi:MAG: hypothetical protein ACM3O4_00875 [Ignavibacteriales bacterium]